MLVRQCSTASRVVVRVVTGGPCHDACSADNHRRSQTHCRRRYLRVARHRGYRGRARHRYLESALEHRAHHIRFRLRQHRQHAQRDHVHQRRGGDPPLPRLPDRAARDEEHVPGDLLPGPARRATDAGATRQLHEPHHQPLAAAREDQPDVRRVPAGRTSDGGDLGGGGFAVDLLPGFARPARPGAGGHLHVPAAGQAADGMRVRVQVRDGPAVQLPAQRSQLRRKHALDDVRPADRGVRDQRRVRARP